MKENLWEEMMNRNQASLEQVYGNVNTIILSTKNMAYRLSNLEEIKFLNTRESMLQDTSGNLEALLEILSITENFNEYLDSVCIYFAQQGVCVTNRGGFSVEEYEDKECLELYRENMPERTNMQFRKKNGKYPYLLTIATPIPSTTSKNIGAVFINIDVEKLGEYLGSGQYRNSDYSPMLLIFDEAMETLVYSDEYRLLKGDEELLKLQSISIGKEGYADIHKLWGYSFVVSGISSEKDGLQYLYLSTMYQFEEQSKATDRMLLGAAMLLCILCLILASLLAVWVYNPIRSTIHTLEDMTMLMDWDKKEHIDEIEAIQRSILLAKKEKDNLNEQIQERMISLHNAQICALQTQINPHFLYNTLEAIGNAAALMMNGDNQVTEMIYSLGSMMRISLSGENYLVPLEEELNHVELYVKLLDFRFRERVTMHMEIPEKLKKAKIVKLTLQPLIENAVQHGLGYKRNNGSIWLKGECIGDWYYIHVIDNGEGISEEGLVKLNEQLKESSINTGRHIGLRNVDQRLKLVFGEEGGLMLSKAEEGGLCVTIRYKMM